MSLQPLRRWQQDALAKWLDAGHRGIVSVVTGGGKTVFALACIEAARPPVTLIVVPTTALLEQWQVEVASYFGLDLDEVHLIRKSTQKLRVGSVNIAVLNTASRLTNSEQSVPVLLVVDECHKAASDAFKKVLDLPTCGSLGLSATPERQYDDGLANILEPGLGKVIYTYGYDDALRDGVIVPFELRNVVFDLEEDRQAEYDKLTRAIARSISRSGVEEEATVALFIRRARVLNLSSNRVRLTIRLIAKSLGKQTLVFHEDIEACDVIDTVLRSNGVRSGVYHSRLTPRVRAAVLHRFREKDIQVLVTCRALDEGFNVPEVELGIIAASTATTRQRIQRLGRIVRPAPGKKAATVITLVATSPEIARLKEEERALEGVARVSWTKA